MKSTAKCSRDFNQPPDLRQNSGFATLHHKKSFVFRTFPQNYLTCNSGSVHCSRSHLIYAEPE